MARSTQTPQEKKQPSESGVEGGVREGEGEKGWEREREEKEREVGGRRRRRKRCITQKA